MDSLGTRLSVRCIRSSTNSRTIRRTTEPSPASASRLRRLTGAGAFWSCYRMPTTLWRKPDPMIRSRYRSF